MKRKVLLVDDDPRVLELVEAVLENDGSLETITATNGEDALHLARQWKPHLVFLDVQMPRMNGYEVCMALKRDAATADINVIILTGLTKEFDREKALIDVGADGYMAKPFSPSELLQRCQMAPAERSLS